MQYERRAPRHLIRQRGLIAHNDESLVGECLILDLSVSGARIKSKTPDLIPDTFKLFFTTRARIFRHCAVVWRSDSAVGVRFLQPGKQPGAAARPKIEAAKELAQQNTPIKTDETCR